MSIQKYQAFVRTVETGSFTRAAEKLGYTQSGVSHMIADLERDWGVALLERSRSGVRLTSDGLKLLPHAKEVCAANERLMTALDDLRGLDAGLIRMGTFSSVTTHWLPNIIQRFEQDYPNIQFEMRIGAYTEIEEWIHDGQVDCGFVQLPVSPELESEFLVRDRLLVVLPEDHPLAARTTFPVEGLSKEPFIMLEQGANREIAEFFRDRGIEPNVRFSTWDDYAVMAMVEKGLGISILPELVLRRIPYRLIAKELEIAMYRDLGIAMRSRKSAPLAVKRFLDYLDYRQ